MALGIVIPSTAARNDPGSLIHENTVGCVDAGTAPTRDPSGPAAVARVSASTAGDGAEVGHRSATQGNADTAGAATVRGGSTASDNSTIHGHWPTEKGKAIKPGSGRADTGSAGQRKCASVDGEWFGDRRERTWVGDHDILDQCDGGSRIVVRIRVDDCLAEFGLVRDRINCALYPRHNAYEYPYQQQRLRHIGSTKTKVSMLSRSIRSHFNHRHRR